MKGRRLGELLAAPFRDMYRGLERCLDGGPWSLAQIAAGLVVGFGRDPVTEVSNFDQNAGIKRSGNMTLAECEVPLDISDALCWLPSETIPPPGEEVSTCNLDSGGPMYVYEESGKRVCIVISSDMSHYVPVGIASATDKAAIEKMIAIDPEGLHRVVSEQDISMCGFAPAVAGLEAVKRAGAGSGRLIAYASSGDTNGDYDSVVGYAGLVFS